MFSSQRRQTSARPKLQASARYLLLRTTHTEHLGIITFPRGALSPMLLTAGLLTILAKAEFQAVQQMRS
ncbi:hypothetical protein PSV08DRAFT_295485, partial [Bipolaris maydis]|uniref:uncharacterized protein n=1 Tax=Cochliobolus heterostrophus TaxID=5016 RepID=UPI0024D8FD92